MAKLKATVDSLDSVPEAHRELYVEVKDDDGVRFVLDADGVEDVTGLKSALGKERKANRDIGTALRKLGLKADAAAIGEIAEKLGDGRTIEDIIEEREASTTNAATTAAKEVDKATRRLKGELETAQATIATQAAFIDRTTRENALRTVLALPEFEASATLMLPALMPETAVVEEDGATGKEYVARVIDPKTKEVRMKGGREMTLQELVAEKAAMPEYAGAFGGTGASGSGATSSRRVTSPAVGGSGNRAQPDAVTAKRQSNVGYSI